MPLSVGLVDYFHFGDSASYRSKIQKHETITCFHFLSFKKTHFNDKIHEVISTYVSLEVYYAFYNTWKPIGDIENN